MVCLFVYGLSIPSSISTNTDRQIALPLAGRLSLPALLPPPMGSRCALVGVPIPFESSLEWLFAGEVGDMGRDEGPQSNQH